MAKTAAQAVQGWQRGMQGATQAYTEGVQGVTENPAQKAIQAIPLQVQRVADAAASGKTAASLGRVTLESWKQAAIQKGASRLASGAAQALPKFTRFMSQFLPHAQQVAASVRQMPKMTLEDSIARASAQIRGNAAFKMT